MPFRIQPPAWQQWWFWLLGLVLFMILSLIAFRIYAGQMQRRQKLREALIQSQLSALRARMNPHFIYNILNSIQGLVFSGQKEEAAENIGAFSHMMRRVLDFSARQMVSLDEELETLSTYLSIEKLRMPDLEYHLEVDPTLSPARQQLPSMIVQPIVENAVHHGLYHLNGAKALWLRFKKQEDFLVIDVEDHGIGREAAIRLRQRRRRHEPFAESATEQRIALMSQLLGSPIRMEVKDLFNAEGQPAGTLVQLFIPLTHEHHQGTDH
jgi:LytS/YehU family sensor histidine kinase